MRMQLDRRLVTILLIVFVQMLGAAMILPILPLYAQREFSLTPQVITLLNTTFFAAQFIAGPYLGRLSDRVGRVPVLIISQIGTALSFLMLAWAPNAWMLFAARLLDGITGGNIIVAQAYVTDITPREKRTQSLGYIMAVFGIGFIFGPALGGLLAGLFGPRVPYVIAAVMATLVVILTRVTLDETLSAEQRAANRARRAGSLAPAQIVRNRLLLYVIIVAFVGQFGFGMLQATFALYGEAVLFQGYSRQATDIGIGLLLAVVGVGQLFTQVWLLRKLLKKYSEPWLVVGGAVLRASGMMVLAAITTPWLGILGGLSFAIGAGLMMPSLQSIATLSVSDGERGGVLGVMQSVNSLAIIFSTAIAGTIFAMGPTLPYWLGAFLTLLVLIPAIALIRAWESQPAQVPERG
jgi:DHA1 family tetracycline resistance protein-like MFS transporter